MVLERSFHTANTLEDGVIMSHKCRMFLFDDVERFHEKSAEVGLSEQDLWTLVISGLEVSHLVDYVETVLTSRMN
jgi:hypothetical protein